MAPPPSLIFGKFAFSPQGSILGSARCTWLKFGENCLIFADTINIFRNSRWRPPPSLIFGKLALLIQRTNISWCQVFAIQTWLELHFTPFGGRLPPKTAPKRPSKGKFKPKLKIREFELNFVIEDQSSPNFINVCRNIVCIRP